MNRSKESQPFMLQDPSMQDFTKAGRNQYKKNFFTTPDGDMDSSAYGSQRHMSVPGIGGGKTLLANAGQDIMR